MAMTRNQLEQCNLIRRCRIFSKHNYHQMRALIVYLILTRVRLLANKLRELLRQQNRRPRHLPRQLRPPQQQQLLRLDSKLI